MPALFVLVSIVAAASLALFVLRLRSGRADGTGAGGEHFIGSGTWCLGMGEVSPRQLAPRAFGHSAVGPPGGAHLALVAVAGPPS